MQTNHTIQALHSYRAHLMPTDVVAEDVEALARCNRLPTIRVKAASATSAMKKAAHVSGKQVFDVERVEG